MTTTSEQSREWAALEHRWNMPGNRADRESFASLNEWAQHRVRRMADRLYDGSRTAARCWKLALAAELETD